MHNVLHRIGIALLVLGLMQNALAQSGDLSNLTAGAKIEVREGDTWSAASFVRKEGRRYQVKYEGTDSVQEWVTADRIRLPGTAGAPAAPPAVEAPAASPAAEPSATASTTPAPAAAAPAAPEAPKKPVWTNGQKVEIKWGGLWREASIRNRRGEWYLIKYETIAGLGSNEWVEPWRIREIGSKEDTIGHASPNTGMRDGNIDNPPREKPGTPSQPFSARNEPAPDPASVYADDPAYRKVDASTAKELDLEIDSSTTYTPDAAEGTRLATRAIVLKGYTGANFERVEEVSMPSGNGRFAFVQTNDHQPASTSDIRIDKVDVIQGQSIAAFTFPTEMVLAASSPDGSAIALRADGFGFGESDRVEIWSMQSAMPKRTLIFHPYGDRERIERDVRWVKFVDATHLLTLDRRGTVLVLWDLTTATPVYSAKVDSTPALSANAKYMAVHTDNAMRIVEALTGKAIVELERPAVERVAPQLSFSPSGQRLAGWENRTLIVWDIASGKLVSEFTVPESIGSMTMTSDDYALAGQNLLDIERRIVLWQYSNMNTPAMGADKRVWFTQQGANRNLQTLAAMPIPDPEALKAAKTLKWDELAMLKPGVSVSLNINVGNNEERQRIIDSMTKQLTDRGINVDGSAPIRIVASVQDGKSEQLEFRPFGRPSWEGTEKFTVTPKITRVAIEYNGKVAWETSTSSGPGMTMSVKEGQTAQQAAQELSQPNPHFVENVVLPTSLPMPKEPAWYGTSPAKPTAPNAQ